MMRISKRGQSGEAISLTVTLVLVLILLVSFYFVIKFVSISHSAISPETVTASTLKISGEESLKAYLQTPVTAYYGGKNMNMTMYDLIMLTKSNGIEKTSLESYSQSIFDRTYSGNYHLSINSGENSIIDLGKDSPFGTSSQLSLPDFNLTLQIYSATAPQEIPGKI